MKARCTSCGREVRFHQPRGFRLDLQRCRCGGSYTRVGEDHDYRPCRGDAWEPVSPRHRALRCDSCARSVYRGGKCGPVQTAEEWEQERADMETRLREP